MEAGRTLSLTFHLEAPRDYTRVYDNLIGLLEMSVTKLIAIDAEQYRHMVADEWDWSDAFFGTNSAYSRKAHTKTSA